MHGEREVCSGGAGSKTRGEGASSGQTAQTRGRKQRSGVVLGREAAEGWAAGRSDGEQRSRSAVGKEQAVPNLKAPRQLTPGFPQGLPPNIEARVISLFEPGRELPLGWGVAGRCRSRRKGWQGTAPGLQATRLCRRHHSLSCLIQSVREGVLPVTFTARWPRPTTSSTWCPAGGRMLQALLC
jgi:hypothetical protein